VPTVIARLPGWLSAPIRLPLAGWPLVVFVAAFLLPGLIGHDPWKAEDAVGFGVAYQMVSSGDWLVPRLAGEPFYEDGPLYFWAAGLFVRALAGVLPPHAAARFASAAFILMALWFVRLAARELYGKREGDLSVLALMGCVGLLWHAHEAAAENAMLAGLAAAYYGVAISHRKPLKSGICFGLGAAVAFLAKGLVALLQPLAAALLVLPLCASFRQRTFAFSVGLGLAILVPLVVAWTWLVALREPAYFQGWVAWQLSQVSHLPTLAATADLLKTLVWAAWPVWPLTIWATWEYRRQLREPGFAVPFVATIVSLALLLFMERAREMEMLGLLVPLAIPAGAAAVGARRGAANALAWFAVMTFTLAAGYMWFMWLATLTGFPDPIARHAARLQPGFVMHVAWVPLAFAVTLTVAWLVLVTRAERSTLRSLTFWTAGVTLVWGLATTLWLDWIDYAKSFRPIAQSLRKALPEKARCVESRGLGETQRAVFHYHAGLVTRRVEVHGPTDCPYLLVQSSSRDPAIEPGGSWRRVWEGSRSRDRERYRLYRRG
jgi:4-amino-4-deoxy-L-arabinose transferase-like glycosyltransferase